MTKGVRGWKLSKYLCASKYSYIHLYTYCITILRIIPCNIAGNTSGGYSDSDSI